MLWKEVEPMDEKEIFAVLATLPAGGQSA